MNDLELTIRAFLEAASSDDTPDLRPASAGVMEAARQAAFDDLHGAVAMLSRGLELPDLERAAVVGLTCGALVEMGAHPEAPTPGLIKRLEEAGPLARRLLVLASREAPGDEIEEALLVDVARRNPVEAKAWASIDRLGLAAIACLSRRGALRREAMLQKPFVDAVAGLADVHPRMNFLGTLLRVLDDEELVVLHPSSGRGWLFEIAGVSDNFQLHTLLAAALVGPSGLPGEPPPPEVVAVMTGEGPQALDVGVNGWFNLYQWNIIRPDGSLPEGPRPASGDQERWVWGEGAPDDLERFEGRRTLVLGPSTYQRAWQASRTFPALLASVELVRTLSAEEVAGLLARMAAATPLDS